MSSPTAAAPGVFEGTFGDSRVGWQVKRTHVLPVLIQCCIYTYWGLYWRELTERLPVLVWLLGVAYLLDAVLQLAVRKRYVLSFAPMPVVLSSGLFVLFPPERWHIMAVAVVVAMLSKTFVRSRGRHIFNPSGVGLAVLGLLTIAFPSLSDGEIAHAFSVPPNMTEVLVIAALIAQTRVPVVLMTIAAWLGMTLQIHLLTIMPHLGLGGGPFEPLWAPVALVLVLLITDPATSPKTPRGQVLFGLFMGVATGLAGEVLMILGASDYYGKVLAVPIANGFAPLFDQLGGRLPKLAALDRRHNLKHVAAWLVIVIIALPIADKGSFFGGDLHEHSTNRTPGVVARDDGSVSCDDNPMQCEPFAFIDEAACWIAHFRGEAPCGNLHERAISEAMLRKVAAGGRGQYGKAAPEKSRRP